MKTKIALNKETKIKEILDLIDGTYTKFSGAYSTTKHTLSKLSLEELDSLYVMISTTVDLPE